MTLNTYLVLLISFLNFFNSFPLSQMVPWRSLQGLPKWDDITLNFFSPMFVRLKAQSVVCLILYFPKIYEHFWGPKRRDKVSFKATIHLVIYQRRRLGWQIPATCVRRVGVTLCRCLGIEQMSRVGDWGKRDSHFSQSDRSFYITCNCRWVMMCTFTQIPSSVSIQSLSVDPLLCCFSESTELFPESKRLQVIFLLPTQARFSSLFSTL